MNYWTGLSVEYANQRNYLDELYKVYPIVPGLMRELPEDSRNAIEDAFNRQDRVGLLRLLLDLDLFPLKDSYVAYLKRDPTAVERNPETVNRLYGRLVEIGLDEIINRSSQPKETNRQIGPLFNHWLKRKTLGVEVLPENQFLASSGNVVLAGNDRQLKEFAEKHLNYRGEKGLDFVARFNNKFIVGEAKFLTDYGGHQNAQFADALHLLHDSEVQAIKVAILDGVLYIKRGNNKMHRYLVEDKNTYNILSSLLLRDFLYQL